MKTSKVIISSLLCLIIVINHIIAFLHAFEHSHEHQHELELTQNTLHKTPTLIEYDVVSENCHFCDFTFNLEHLGYQPLFYSIISFSKISPKILQRDTKVNNLIVGIRKSRSPPNYTSI